MDNVRGLLRDRGYQEFSPGLNKYACAAYQKIIRIHDGGGILIGKRFINVWEYDQRQFLPNTPSMRYEVEQTFETSLDSTWFTGKFYGLDSHQMRALLPELEKLHDTLFTAMKGIYQD